MQINLQRRVAETWGSTAADRFAEAFVGTVLGRKHEIENAGPVGQQARLI
jgi:hypothetical protein